MLRKLFLGVGAISLLSGLSWLTPVGGYGRCAINWMTQSAQEAVPLEWEIKRARQMIGDLQPQIADNAKRIAREKIELARLQRQAKQCGQSLQQSQHDIERLTADLRDGHAQYIYAGQSYSAAEVRSDLAARFDRFKTRRETHDKLQQLVAAREASLRSAGQRMDAMLTAKSQLEVELENLNARLGSLRVAQTASELNLDDSHLAKTRELLDDLAARLEVAEEIATAEVRGIGQIQLDAPADRDLLDQIAQYLDQQEPTSADNAGSLAAIVLE